MTETVEALETVQKKAAEAEGDLALKQSQVKAVEEELSKREAEIVRHLQLQQKYEDDKGKLYAENKKFEAESATAKRGLEFAEKEMAELKTDSDAVRRELKKYMQDAEAAKVQFVRTIARERTS